MARNRTWKFDFSPRQILLGCCFRHVSTFPRTMFHGSNAGGGFDVQIHMQPTAARSPADLTLLLMRLEYIVLLRSPVKAPGPDFTSERPSSVEPLSSHRSQFTLNWLPPAAGPCSPRGSDGGISRRVTGQLLDPSSISVLVIALSTFVCMSFPGSQGPLGSYLPNCHVPYQSRRGTCSSLPYLAALLKDVSGTDRSFRSCSRHLRSGPISRPSESMFSVCIHLDESRFPILMAF
jgi:hypothetical protein